VRARTGRPPRRRARNSSRAGRDHHPGRAGWIG
jgi:hypothetical protein